jgi:alkylation response protein AidB-like acyl-CoA dehydrogenase
MHRAQKDRSEHVATTSQPKGDTAMPAIALHPYGDDLNTTDMTARAATLIPLINERAEEAAAAAALPTDLVEVLESQGFFCMALPRNLGGLELDPVTMLLTAETLAWADGSTAWTVMIGNSSIAFAWLDQAVAARLLNGRSGQPLASMFAPTGRAV